MTESAHSGILQRGRGLRILSARLIQNTGEIEEYNLANAAMTIITGPRNSSKTTTLKVIDYCLGNRDSVAEALGAPIEDKYIGVGIDIAVDGREYRLRRTFDRGQRGRISIDDQVDISAQEFSAWLLEKLAWPQLTIPLGRNALTATQQVPLSFRNMFRHIYRREDSWTEFAVKEQEFLRRAVISLFLGFAQIRYETADYELGQAQRKLAAAEAVYREVLESTDESIQALVRQLGLPPIMGDEGLGAVRQQLTVRVMTAQAERDSLAASATQAVQPTDQVPGLDPTLPQQLEKASAEAAAAAEQVAGLQQVLTEHERSRALVEADVSRLHRLIDAVDIFDELPVRICPACEQPVDPERSQDPAICYLCAQPVAGDIRQRRAEREERALRAELNDLVEAIDRAREDLSTAHAIEANASRERTRLSRQLHDTRATRLAPFMAALEDIAAEIGRIKQQLASLPALETILARRKIAANNMTTAQGEVERLTKLAAADARVSSDIPLRCAKLADRMNEFLTSFESRHWVEGQVTISADDVTFYVGTRPWQDSLGAEARVLFFLAYNYALLHLDTDLGEQAYPPGALLLDNPYQQGIRPEVVLEAVNRLASAANHNGVQVVLTQSRGAAGITAAHAEIRMTHEYTSFTEH
jgi:hypothetical protein